MMLGLLLVMLWPSCATNLWLDIGLLAVLIQLAATLTRAPNINRSPSRSRTELAHFKSASRPGIVNTRYMRLGLPRPYCCFSLADSDTGRIDMSPNIEAYCCCRVWFTCRVSTMCIKAWMCTPFRIKSSPVYSISEPPRRQDTIGPF